MKSLDQRKADEIILNAVKEVFIKTFIYGGIACAIYWAIPYIIVILAWIYYGITG